jgi:hypothetical protein
LVAGIEGLRGIQRAWSTRKQTISTKDLLAELIDFSTRLNTTSLLSSERKGGRSREVTAVVILEGSG